MCCCCFFFLYKSCLKQPCVFTNGSKRRRSETRDRFLPLVRFSLDVCQHGELMWNNTGELRSPGCQVRFWLEAWSHSPSKQQQTVLICSARQQVPKRSSVSMKSHIWPLWCEISVKNNSSSTLNFYHPCFFSLHCENKIYVSEICKFAKVDNKHSLGRAPTWLQWLSLSQDPCYRTGRGWLQR